MRSGVGCRVVDRMFPRIRRVRGDTEWQVDHIREGNYSLWYSKRRVDCVNSDDDKRVCQV